MKKLLIAFMLIFVVSCAAPAAPTNKCITSPPPAAPSQQEVLTKARVESETLDLQLWWAEENITFSAWLSTRAATPVTVEFIESSFLNNYKVAVMYVHASSKNGSGDLYVVASKVEGRWKVTRILGAEPDAQDVEDVVTEQTL